MNGWSYLEEVWARRRMRWATSAGLVVTLAGSIAAAPETAPVKPVDYNHDIRPLLSDTCYACHGPDENKRKAKFRLDLREVALQPAKSGAVPIVPGQPEQSELIRRITEQDPDEVMPPRTTGKSLTRAQIELIQRWIQEGASYAQHWAFTPLTRPPEPETPAGWMARNPIDHFIQARLAKEGLRPAPEADRRTLLRRVTLDLTGLPPAASEVEAFVRSRDPEAYEKRVRDLLASARFGERMAVHWLDLVRYADTVGFHGDMPMNVWPYRDYIINAFNQNLSFDQFTRDQIAGDLLPQATRWQRIASAYNRLNRISTEGGIQDKEYRAKYAADRVRTTGTVWLGATLGCAECHDHKFDPYTTRDFYRFAAFFSDLEEKGFYEQGFSRGNWGPSMALFSAPQEKELARLDAAIAEAKTNLTRVADSSLDAGRDSWEQTVLAAEKAGDLGWKTQPILQARSSGGATLTIDTNHAVSAEGASPDQDVYTVLFRPGPGLFTALRLETLQDENLPGNRIGRGGITYFLTEVEIHAQHGRAGTPRRVILAEASADANDPGHPIHAAFDGRADTSWGMIYGHSKEHQAVFVFEEPLRATEKTLIRLRLRQESESRRATIGKFKLSLATMPHPSRDTKGVPDDVLKAMSGPTDKRTENQLKRLAAYYREVAPELREARRRVATLEAERSVLQASIPNVLVSAAVTPRTMRILPRGDWMNDSGEEVQPGVPAFLPSSSRAAPEGRLSRLELADWLVSPGNPLTSRAVMNRFWKLFFGSGMSRTLDDLGAQGEPPSHPALLDWLAIEFRESGWDMKHMIELIVTSATYRQSSQGDPRGDELDPRNRLWSRQNRLRLDAEFVRDNALAISGLLVNEVGGRSVFPFQPEGYWAPLNFPKREYVLDNGANRYRRGVYMHWQRTFPHPSLVAFDAPPREECTASRPVSNTPLQALVLLNDPNFVETARALADQILEHGGARFESRLDWVFRRALARPPSPDEVQVLRQLYDDQRERYRTDAASARALVGDAGRSDSTGSALARRAAWISVSRTLLNLHETITRY